MTVKKSNGQDAPKMEVKKAEQTPALVQTPKNEKPTYEELLTRLEELEKVSIKKPQNIEEIINFYEEKKKKINHLEEFKMHLASLEAAHKLSKSDADKNDFENKKFALFFNEYRDYGNGSSLFKITNAVIISDCLSFIIMKLTAKIQLLESEIQREF